MGTNPIAADFESSFLSQPLAQQVADCDHYELAPLFLELFRDNQPVLEAGCGSGRWCAWLSKHGIKSHGIDWSEELCNRARAELPECEFTPCDMGKTSFDNGTFGGLMALGSIEHDISGPVAILKEFRRILRDGGKAVIIVPYGGWLRRGVRFISRPVRFLKTNRFVRRICGVPAAGTTLREARAATTRAWRPRFSYGHDGWHFHEYEFGKRQMRRFLAEAGLSVRREFAGFHNEGVLHNFGRIAGRWCAERSDVELTIVGRVLRASVPVSVCGHMLCYVVERPGMPDAQAPAGADCT
jgi:SAM-dependent methyltransferase